MGRGEGNMKAAEDRFGQGEEKGTGTQKTCAAPRVLHKEWDNQAGGSQWRKENPGRKTTLVLGLELTLSTDFWTASLTALLTLSQKNQA